MLKTRPLLAALGLIGLTSLAACHGSDASENVGETNVTAVNETGIVNVSEPDTPPAPNTASVPPALTGNAESLSVPAQVQEDADATGMTAHVDRNQSTPQ